MGFEKQENAYNKYGEYIGKTCTCTVCGKSWDKTTRNDSWNEQGSCGSVALFKEWDDSTALVHFEVLATEDVSITYQDGVTHLVNKDYFKTHAIHIYR